VTTGRSAPNHPNLRRRLTPAAQVFLLAAAALLLSGIVPSGDGRQGDPPAGRPLPHAALGAERAERAPARRPLNLVDREAARPRRIRIPAIGVSARMVPLGLAAERTMETPRSSAEAGWFEPGREPGERGPAVVVGHVDSTSGPGVFYRLRELRRGNLISVGRADGSVVRFRVEGLERWPKVGFPTGRVFGRTPVATLRLVTCSGTFDQATGHYVDNTIVYAARVGARS
jgi:Sortase domain